MEVQLAPSHTASRLGEDTGPRPAILIRRAPPALPRPAEEAPRPTRWVLPLVLFVATCWSTWLIGGVAYALALMLILTAHELGHYWQARHNGVPTTLPYFLPVPVLSPFGTMGAVISMRPGAADRKALYDLAITGPIAGLIPALAACWVGLGWSTVQPTAQIDAASVQRLGEPLIFELLTHWKLGPLPEGSELLLHPLAYAGWVGIFITALNLLPFGQLDGGHILYALLPRRAHLVSSVLFGGAALAVAIKIDQYWPWILLMLLLTIFGIHHPPAAREDVPLGTARVVLGWSTLLFVVVGFTPQPFIY